MNYFRSTDGFFNLLSTNSFVKFGYNSIRLELPEFQIHIQPSSTYFIFRNKSTIVVRSKYSNLSSDSRCYMYLTLREIAAEINHRTKFSIIIIQNPDHLIFKSKDDKWSIDRSQLTIVDDKGISHVFSPAECYIGNGPDFSYCLSFNDHYNLRLKYEPSKERPNIKEIEYVWTHVISQPMFEELNITTVDDVITKIRDNGSSGIITRGDKTLAVAKEVIDTIQHAPSPFVIRRSIDAVLRVIEYY